MDSRTYSRFSDQSSELLGGVEIAFKVVVTDEEADTILGLRLTKAETTEAPMHIERKRIANFILELFVVSN